MARNDSTAILEMEEQQKSLPLEEVLPLVIEIIPGQAGEGLIDVYEPGSYEGRTLRELVEETLNKNTWSLDERQVLEDINRQLSGGKLLWRGQEIQGSATEYAVIEQTEAGERYYYVPIRVIRPQEGGGQRLGLLLNPCRGDCG